MNEIDYVILGLIIISLLIGFLRGFVKEILSLAAWIIGIWIGLNYNHQLATPLKDVIAVPAVRIAVAFVFLLTLTLIFSNLISYLLSLCVEKIGLIVVDRFAGMLLGLARGMLIVAVLVMLIELTPIQEQHLWRQSSFIPFFQTLAMWLKEQLPSEIANLSN